MKQSGKIIKKLLKGIGLTLAGIFLLLVVFLLAIRTSTFQTYITQKSANYLSTKVGAKVSVEKVYINFFSELDIRGLYVEDMRSDTLLFADELQVELSAYDLDNMAFELGDVRVASTQFYLRKHKGDSTLNLQFLLDAFASEDTSKTSFLLQCEALTLENIEFRYDDYNTQRIEKGVDFSHLRVSNFQLNANNFLLEEDTIAATIGHINLIEQSGFILDHLSAYLNLNPTELRLDGLQVLTQETHLETDLAFQHESYASYADFVESVRLNLDIRDGTLQAGDIAYFAPVLSGIDKLVSVTGQIKGTISQIKGRNLAIRFGKSTYLSGKVDMLGLPSIEETFISMRLKELVTNKADLDQIPIPPFDTIQYLQTPKELARLGNIRFNGSFTGFINDFVAYGNAQTALGNVRSDVNLKQDSASGVLVYKGELATSGFQLGKMMNEPKLLGLVQLNVQIEGQSIMKDKAAATLIGTIGRFDFNGYSYHGIEVSGDLADREFNGKLNVRDTNLNLDFTGVVDLSETPMLFDFNVDIKKAYLTRLNLLARDSSAKISGRLHSNFRGIRLEKIVGQVNAQQLAYSEKGKSVVLDSLQFKAFDDDKGRVITVNSDYLVGKLNGEFNTQYIGKSLLHLVSRVAPAYFGDKIERPPFREIFDIELQLKDLKVLTDLFIPELVIPEDVSIDGQYSGIGHTLFLNVKTPDFSYGSNHFKGVALKANVVDDVLTVDTDVSHIVVNDSVSIDAVNVFAKALADNLQFDFSWDNETVLKNSGNLAGLVHFTDRDEFQINFLTTDIVLEDSLWQINKDNEIIVDSTSFAFQNVVFSNANHSLGIRGKLSENENDKLFLDIKGFDLSYFNVFTSQAGVLLKGNIEGNAVVSNVYENLIFDTDFDVTGIAVNGTELGQLKLFTKWDGSNESIKIDSRLRPGINEYVNVQGYYFPKRKVNNLNLGVDAKSLSLLRIEPLIASFISDMEGAATASLRITGSTSAPEMEGELQLDSAAFRLNYLNTFYRLGAEPIVIGRDKFQFNKLQITDLKGHNAFLDGSIGHTAFQKYTFDLGIEAKNFQFLNTKAADSDLYYGQAYLTGDVKLEGTPQNILIDIKAKTNKGTKFFIPLSGSTEVSESNFITFVNRDSSQISFEEDEKVDLTGIQMNFALEVTDDAAVEIIFDEKVGDILKAKGNGNLQLEINTLGNFNIYGEYVISEGDYLFTLQNIINKRFKIESGGNIVWNGSPNEARVDLNAIYRLRATPYDLVSAVDTSARYKKRVPVDCSLRMLGNVFTPNISFDVNLPSLPESDVANQLLDKNTLSEQEMNQQIFSLLLINRFVPPDQQVHTAGIGSSSSSEVLSNQLSNWLSQISNDFDIGFNYRSGDEISAEEVEVALSTQIFNDRVILEGNVGVSGNNPQADQNTNAVVGDFNVEYKINEDGSVRAKVFNKANDYNQVNANNSPYTQGVGIFYRKEFDTFGEFMRSIFSKKSKGQKKVQKKK